LGVAAALTIEVNTLSPDQIEVKVGAGAWYDKLTMASLGFLFFLPLVLIAAAWGTWQQAQLDKKIWEVIESGLPTATEQLLPWNASPLPDPELPTDWFNPETGEIYSMRFFMRMTSWQQAMADGVIDPVEIAQQSSLVLELLQTLETGLSDEVHNHLGEVFGELIALQAMQSAALVRKLTP
jgi:hypothetical protein